MAESTYANAMFWVARAFEVAAAVGDLRAAGVGPPSSGRPRPPSTASSLPTIPGSEAR